MKSRLLLGLLALKVALPSVALADTAFEFAYGGRLVTTGGKPIDGPVALKATFYHDGLGQTPVLSIVDGLTSVALQQGIFQVRLQMSAADYDKVFPDTGTPVWIQITDLTHFPSAPFPLQQLEMTPYAARVPVDNATISFNSEGKLTVGPSSAPGSGQFLTKDASGNMIWGTPPSSASALQGNAISSTPPSAGQVLQYNGSQWLPATFSGGAGTLTSVTASAPLVVTGGATTPSVSITQATSVSDGYVSSGDWLTFNSKQPALGFTPVNKAGDTMTGTLNMGAQTLTNLAAPSDANDAATKTYVDTNTLRKDGTTALSGNWAVGGKDITAIGNVGISATKTLTLGIFTNSTETALIGTLDSSGATSPDKGKTWFNSQTNQVRYWDGSTVQSLGVSGAGLTSLNGQSGSTQTFNVTQTGNLPAINSNLNVHTLSIPLANAGASVSAGLISNADYLAFSGKQASGSYLTALTGDVSATGPGSSVATLATTGVAAGTYVKVTVDTKGRVTAASTLTAADIPNLSAAQITSGTLATSVGGTGVNSTATFPTSGVVVTETAAETLTNKTLTTPIVSQISNTGLLTLPTSTDTLVGRDTTDTLTNKTLTSPLITAATINGASTIGGSTVIGTTGTISSGAHTVAGNVTIQGNGTTANKLVMNDKGTTNSLSFKAPDTLAGSVLWTFPGSDGTSGQLLSTNGSGTLSWVAGAAPTGAAGGDLAGTFPNPTLAATGTAGSYTKVTTDSKGRVTSGTTLSAADIPTLPASIIGGVGALGVANGGTGDASLTNNGVLIGNGTGNVVTTAAGLAYQSLTVPSGGGTPSFSAIDLSQSAAITGTLQTANGGTGVSSTATFPTSGVIVTEAATETLTNKTLTTPVISSISNTGVLTLPTSTDTLVGRATTDTLTNKTLTATTINGASSIGGSTTIATTGTISSGSDTVAGNVTIQGNATTANKLILNDKGTTNSLAFKSPDTLASSVIWTLPGTDGTSGQLLTTNGSGTLSWASGSSPTGAAGGDLVGTYPNPTLATSGVTAGTYPKVTVDAKGRVTAGLALAAGDLPVLGASGAGHAAGAAPDPGASAGTTRYLREDSTWVIPSASGTAGGDLTGTYPNPTLAAAGTAGTYTKVTTDSKGRVTSGTSLTAADIPALSASAITSGTLATAVGGTGVSSTATFPTSGVVVTEGATETLTNKTLTTPVISSISNTGVLTLPTSTDTLVGRATADTLTNKTLTAATINGASTIGGSTVIATSGTISSGAETVAGNVTIQGNSTTANKLVLNDKGTTNALSFKSPDTLAASVTWTLPGVDGGSGQLLSTNGSGTLSWVAGAAPTGTAGGDLTGSFPNPTLAAAGTAGSYTKVTTDSKGRVTSGTTLTAADIPTLPASIIGGVGALGVANGGTGDTSLTNNGVLLGNGTGNVVTTAAGLAYQSLTVPSGGGTPSFSAINLSQSAAITGTLPTANGGTGISSTATFPAAGTIVTETGTETLTNKTLTTPVISSISNTGLLTLPTSTDTLVGRATTDTLTNKTLTAATINGASSIGGSTVISTTGTISAAATTVAGNVTIQGNSTTANKLILNDKGTTNALSFKAPDTLSGSVAWTLPGADGTTGQILTTNGTGTLSWVSGAAATGTAGGDLIGSYPNPTLATSGVTAGTYPKVTVDAKGRVTAGAVLAAGDLPVLGASGAGHAAGAAPDPGASAGTTRFLREDATWVIPSASGTAGGDLTGTYPNPTLTTSGVTAGTYTKVTVDAKGRATAGTTLVAADLPALSAAMITSGTLATAVGGTGVSSTATFPTSGVVVTEGGTETLTNKTLTAPVISSISNTGVLTLPTSTDTLVGRATTDTLTNKTLTAATINGASTIGGSTIISTTGTISSGAETVAGNVTIQGNSTTANKLVLNDKGTTNALSFKAPDTLSGSVAWTLPGADGTTGQILTTNGTGTLSWVSGAAATGTAGGDLTGSYPSPTLATSGVTAGTYTKVTVDAKGRATAGTTLAATDIPTLPASIIGGVGALGVANGGTGDTNLTTNGVLLGNATGNVVTTAAGLAYQSFTVPSGGGTPSFSAVNLSQAAAITGTLPVANGGTGASTAAAALTALGAASSGANSSITSLTGLTTALSVPQGGSGLTTKTLNGMLYGNGTSAEGVTAAGSQYQVFQAGASGVPTVGALNLAQSAAVTGALGVANGGTGLTAAPANGQIPIGNATNYTLATLTGGNGITVTNGSGSINIASTVTPSTYVAVAGSTMTGILNLPTNGLIAGANQLVLANGNVGIGSTAPALKMEVYGAAGLPASSGSTQTGVGRFSGPSNNVLDIGQTNASPYGVWLQGTDRTSLGINYPILLQPNGGNVGIGTSNPVNPLEVQNPGVNAYLPAAAFYAPNNTTAGNATQLRFGQSGSAGNSAEWRFVYQGSNSASNRTDFGWYGSANPVISYTLAGNVGIGTSAPVALLDVAYASGSSHAMTISGTTGNVGIGTIAPAGTLEVVNGGSLCLGGSCKTAWPAATGQWTTSGSNIYNNNAANVGIGTSSPALALHVYGATGAPATSGTAETGVLRLDQSQGNVLDMGLYTASPYAAWMQVTNRSNLALNYPIALNPNGGNVGIGTASPSAPLDIVSYTGSGIAIVENPLSNSGYNGGTMLWVRNSSTATTNTYLQLTSGWNGSSGTQFGQFGLGANNALAIYNGSGSAVALQPSGGNVGIGTTSPAHTLEVAGTAANTSGGSWLTISDIRMKTIEGDYEYGLDEIKKLHTVRFKYKEGNALNLPTDLEHTGFIAQEVQKVIPDAVILRPDGYLELNVDPIHWATVNAVQQLALENDQLKADSDSKIAQLKADSDSKIAQLKADSDSKIAQLKADNVQLKAALCSKFSDLAICGR